MKRAEKGSVKKISISLHIGGRKKPVSKEALVDMKSGEIIRFVQMTAPHREKSRPEHFDAAG